MNFKDILEVENFFEVDPRVLSGNFPWSYPGDNSYKSVQAHYHLLISRNFQNPKVVSEYFPYFESIFRRFCTEHSVRVNKVFGAAVHQTFDSRNAHQPFHVDFPFEHKVLIMYLTDDFRQGHTLITKFKKKPEGPMVIDTELDVHTRVEPKAGKVLCFDGLRYHAAEYPLDGRRVVCIFTFL